MRYRLSTAMFAAMLAATSFWLWNANQTTAGSTQREGQAEEPEAKPEVLRSTPAPPQATAADTNAKQLAELETTLRDREQKLQQTNLQVAVLIRELGDLKKKNQEAFALTSAIWPQGTPIQVSWEDPRPEHEQARRWVRAAIERTWQGESGLVFTGWEEARFDSPGIRIAIVDDANEGPHCKRLGRFLNGQRSGMVLNFSFRNWCTQCTVGRSLQQAIENVAIHEFGHAVGLAHEQNRPDAPGWCQYERQGPDGDFPITLYDPNSIMNYCNPNWNNNGRLSPLDIHAVQVLYPKPRAAGPGTRPAP